MRTLYILRGCPGCGKSTFAAELIRNEPGRFVRINRDDLRNMVVGPGNNPHVLFDKNRENLMRIFKDELIKKSFVEGYDVILDDTHLVTSTVKKLHKLAEEIGDVKVIEKCFNVPIDVCIERDCLRPGFARVGESVIRSMVQDAGLDKGNTLIDSEIYYQTKTSIVYLVQDDNLPKVIICDLDGTLAIIGDRSPYDATNCDEIDEPNVPVIDCVKAMYAQGHKIIFVSGRESKYRQETERFIEKYCVFSEHMHDEGACIWSSLRRIPYELYMRPTGDYRKDNIIKRELFDAHIKGKYNVTFVLDDRDQVVLGWRQMGLTCFQVNYGNF